MKEESTIRQQIAKLKRLCGDGRLSDQRRQEAYEAWRTLRWVIEKVDWNPAGLIGRFLDDSEQADMVLCSWCAYRPPAHPDDPVCALCQGERLIATDDAARMELWEEGIKARKGQ